MAKYKLWVTDGNKSLCARYSSLEGNDVIDGNVIDVSSSLPSEWQWHPPPAVSGNPIVGFDMYVYSM